MENPDLCSPAEFVELSNKIVKPPFIHNYYDISSSYRKQAEIAKQECRYSLANALELMSAACSMKLIPDSKSEPFRPFIQREDKRSTSNEYFSFEELNFFTDIYQNIQEPLVRARLADIVWVFINPKNIEHARSAISAYQLLDIDSETWNADIGFCWERTISLAQTIRDSISLKNIEDKLYEAFQKEYLSSPYMKLWIAKLIDNKRICHQSYNDISDDLFSEAHALYTLGAFRDARAYLTLAEKRFQVSGRNEEHLDSLVLIANSFEQEGDQRLDNNTPSQIIANSLYTDALQAFRRVPTKYRDSYGITEKLPYIQSKISKAGVASLDEMVLSQAPGIDISKMSQEAKSHVKNKDNLELALLYFTGFAITSYSVMRENTIKNIQLAPLSNMFGATHMSRDGRVIAKTEGMDLFGNISDNEDTIFKNTVKDFNFHQELKVKGQIIPALNQILSEFRVTRDYLHHLCTLSPAVPDGRENLMASALWLGFEHDFGTCIHVLSPQVEHMISAVLKNHGVQTSNIDKFDIQTENSLNTLLENPIAVEILGDDILFELKALFTAPIGPNLRNEVAHGLLNDTTADSIPSIYTWWFILRLIVRAITKNGPDFRPE